MPGLPQLDDMEGPEKTVRSYLLEWEAPMYLREPFVVAICTARFNIQQFYFLPTQCIYAFCVDLRTNSDYFPIQH